MSLLIFLSLLLSNDVDPKMEAAVAVAVTRVDIVKCDIEISKIELEWATLDYERSKQLVNGKAIAATEYIDYRSKYLRTKALYTRNLHRLREAEALVHLARITGEVDRGMTLVK